MIDASAGRVGPTATDPVAQLRRLWPPAVFQVLAKPVGVTRYLDGVAATSTRKREPARTKSTPVVEQPAAADAMGQSTVATEYLA